MPAGGKNNFMALKLGDCGLSSNYCLQIVSLLGPSVMKAFAWRSNRLMLDFLGKMTGLISQLVAFSVRG